MRDEQLISMLAAVGFSIPLVVVSALAYPYMALRLRDSREEHRDPELGIKTGYYLLLSTALMLIIYGLTVFMIDLMDGKFSGDDKKKQEEAQQQMMKQAGIPLPPKKKDSGLNTVQRVALGLVVSGLLFSLTMMVLLKAGTNDAVFPAAKRVFVGGRLTVAGFVVMIAVSVMIVLMFQKEEDGGKSSEVVLKIYEALTAVLVVWTPVFVIHMILMRVYSAQPYHIDRSSRPASTRRHDDLDDD